jgi:hypothetical protein
MLAWIGIALLSVSWLVGLGYYHLPNPSAWLALVAAGTLLLTRARIPTPTPLQAAIAAALALIGFCLVAPMSLPSRPYLSSIWSQWARAPWPVLMPLALVTLGGAMHAVTGYVRRAGTVKVHNGKTSPGPRQAPSLRENWRDRLHLAPLIAGVVLAVQAAALEGYAAMTARSHELPGPLSHLVGLIAAGLGIDSAVYQSNVPLFSMRTTHNLGATWELFLDPATFCFLIGGVALVVWRAAGQSPSVAANEPKPRRLAIQLAWFVVPVLLWLPLRTGLVLGLFMHEALKTDYFAGLLTPRVLWSTWVHLFLMAGPIVLAWRTTSFAPFAEAAPNSRGKNREALPAWPIPAAAIAMAVAVGLITAAVVCDPVGERKKGRILIEEYNPDLSKIWEPTYRPFDTEWYGNPSGYNYATIVSYTTRFYDVHRHPRPVYEKGKHTYEVNGYLTKDILANYDVLLVKVPTRPFAEDEVAAIKEFVENGGGLFLMGEHTNVFKTGTYLNQIARQFGFAFRDDCLFGVDYVFAQSYRRPLVPHPTVQNVREMEFAVSCSVDPGASAGQAAICSVGLKNKRADYHLFNYYPAPDDAADMRYGAFVQLWTSRHGAGRVAAFTDSTIFSNFCTFDEGKRELWMGILEWLNHKNTSGKNAPGDSRVPMAVVGFILLGAGLWLGRRTGGGWVALAAAGMFGWSAAAYYAWHHPLPDPPRKAQSMPLVDVTFDQSVSRPGLPHDGFISGIERPLAFGVFERWVQRVGYFTRRAKGKDVFQGNLIVFVRPCMPITRDFRKSLLDYVNQGNKILVIDTSQPGDPADLRTKSSAGGWEQTEFFERAEMPSTANDLLKDFGIKLNQESSLSGELVSSKGWPKVFTRATAAVEGGTPFAWINGQPVGASLAWGNQGGSVTVIGYGWRLCDGHMGFSGDVKPEEHIEYLVPGSNDPKLAYNLRQVYEWEFQLLPAIIDNTLLAMPAEKPAEPKPPQLGPK